MNLRRKSALFSTAAFLILGFLQGEPGHPVETPQAVQPLGEGEPVPAVSVRNIDGASRNLQELLSGSPSVLIFYRGGWCPYCNRHLAEMQTIESDLRAMGFRIFAVSPDRPEKLKATLAKNNLSYTLLSDSKAEALKAFGLAFRVEDSLVERYKSQYGIDLEGDSGETHHLLPVPAFYLVDSESTIRYLHYDPDYKSRIDSTTVLTEAKSLIE